MIEAAVVNGTAMLKPEEKGSKTEIAMLKFFERGGVDYEVERKKNVIKMKVPFSSSRKRMVMKIFCLRDESFVLVKGDGLLRVITKGASEIVVGSCSRFHSRSGAILEMSSEIRESVEKAIEQMAN
jgi:Ca2+ transporting ATPase